MMKTTPPPEEESYWSCLLWLTAVLDNSFFNESVCTDTATCTSQAPLLFLLGTPSFLPAAAVGLLSTLMLSFPR